MPNPRMKHRRVVHKSTAGILKPIPEAVDLVGNPPPGLTNNTVASLHQRVSANRRSRLIGVRRATPAERDAAYPALLQKFKDTIRNVPAKLACKKRLRRFQAGDSRRKAR